MERLLFWLAWVLLQVLFVRLSKAVASLSTKVVFEINALLCTDYVI